MAHMTNDKSNCGTVDFKSWYKIGCTTLKLGDCPTFFPRKLASQPPSEAPPVPSPSTCRRTGPSLTPGSGEGFTDAQLAALPNWVHKAGSGNDQVQVGTWTDGKPGPSGTGTPGTWVQQGESIPLDNGKTHASKDFFDPVKKRRALHTHLLGSLVCSFVFSS